MSENNQATKNKDKTLANLGLTDTVPGFRKGITKESLLKSLDDDDWKRIHDIKELHNRDVTNKNAYKLFLLSDQLNVQKETKTLTVKTHTKSIAELANQIHKMEVDLKLGTTELKDGNGTPYTMDDLKVLILGMRLEQERTLIGLRAELSGLYVLVGHLGLDKKILYTEEDYEDTIRWVENNLQDTSLKLFP
jgi:hypothetical protein